MTAYKFVTTTTFDKEFKKLDKSIQKIIAKYSELLPLIEVGASWEVCAFVSHIYLPSSSGSPYPVYFIF